MIDPKPKRLSLKELFEQGNAEKDQLREQALLKIQDGLRELFNASQSPHHFEQDFREAVTRAGYPSLLSPPVRSTPRSTIELPTVAPALWLDRADKHQGLSEFIRETYGPWLGKGLTRAHVHKLDAPLYNALAKWVTVNKTMPEGVDLPTKSEQVTRDLVGFGAHSPAMQSPLDPQQAKERMRLNSAAIRRQAHMPSPKP